MPFSRAEMELRNWRRKHGVCLECGSALDRPGVYVCCEACRNRRNQKTAANRRARIELMKAEFAAEQAEAMRLEAERVKRAAETEKCIWCVWARYINERVVFCPFARCIKRRKEGNGETVDD